MNLIYIVEDFSSPGGVERIVSEKANILSTQYRHNVTVISVYCAMRPFCYKLDSGVNLIQLDVPFAKKINNPVLRLFSRINIMFTAISCLNKVIKQLNPDIIFFTTTLGAILLPFCHTKARRIYESHTARKFNPYHQLFFLTECSADAVVCLTDADAISYRHAKQVMVIPNFIEKSGKCVVDYGVKKAIAVGRLEHVKGFDILISCWQEVARRLPDWQLDIYGEGAYREALQQQIDTLHLGDKVKLCGRHDNIMEIYPRYSLHLMTSRYEGQGLVLIEAQACGLPSVVFNFQYGASDIVTNGHNGLIVEQGNTEQFTEAVIKMLSSEALRKEYGSNALAVGKRYSKENIFKKWIKLIEETVT